MTQESKQRLLLEAHAPTYHAGAPPTQHLKAIPRSQPVHVNTLETGWRDKSKGKAKNVPPFAVSRWRPTRGSLLKGTTALKRYFPKVHLPAPPGQRISGDDELAKAFAPDFSGRH